MKYTAIPWSKLSFVFYHIVLYGLKIIGLAPFSVRNRNALRNDRIQPFKHSKVGSVYTFSFAMPMLLYITIYYINGGADDLQVDDSFSGYIDHRLRISRDIVDFGTTGVILVVWILRQRKAVAALNLLSEVAARLSKMDLERTTEKWIVVTFIIHFSINAVVWILFAVLAADYTSLFDFLVSILHWSPTIISFWFTVEYSMVVNFVVRQLETVNKCLTNYQVLSRLLVQNNVDRITTNCNSHLASIRLLRSMRATLLELCDDIADFFSLPILFVVFHSFLAFFNDLFITFLKTYKLSERDVVTLDAASTFFWIIVLFLGYVYPLASLGLNVTRVNREIGLTGRILNKLLFTVRSRSAIRVELLQFSRELLYDSVDIFTAYGLFSLDLTLLPSMLASTATYFVIQLQFLSPDSGPEPFCNCTADCQ